MSFAACLVALHLSIVLLWFGGTVVVCMTWLPIAVGVARSLRGLECLVHEASHYNWIRRSPCWNDRVANILAAMPVFSSVQSFRAGHLVHHRDYATVADPDRDRYRRLRIDDLDRSSAGRYTLGLIKRIVPYAKGFWATGTTKTTVAYGVVWHLGYLVPLGLLVGVGKAAMLWLLYFVAPFILVLTPLRFVAEAAKHCYDHGNNVFETTISNIGPLHRWLFHPVNDGFHTLHHVAPRIPHHRLRVAHEWLFANDPTYRELQPQRHRVLEETCAAVNTR